MDSYVECLVKGKKNIKAEIGRVALIVLAVLLVAVAFIFWQFWIALFAAAASVGAYVVSGYINVEYEYLYLDKEIVIDRIYNQEKRKRVATYSFEKIQVVAPIKSYHLDKFGKVSEKAVNYGIGIEEKPDRRYVIFFENKDQVIFSPSEEMVKVMKNALPRKVFND
ncbi:MAG: DUF6106 family protein [Lachnospiraceae bacterium]|nr:DUF6106 family protein [Lachnospiraceae bacterium]